MTRRSSTRWRWLTRALAVAGSVVILALVFRRLDVPALAAVFGRMNWGWYLAAQGVFAAGLLGSSIRWHLMLRLNHEAVVHGAASVRMVFISQFFNTLLGGPSGGDLPKTAAYSRWYGVPASHVLAASVLDRMVASAGGLVFVALALGVGYLGGGFEFVPKVAFRWPWAAWWGWVLALGVAVIVGVLVWLARRPGSFLGRSFGAFRGSVGRLLGSRRRSAQALVCAVLTAACFNVTQVLCLQAVLPGAVPWLKLFWMFQLVTAVASMPISFAGAGLREGAAMVLLAQYGVPAPEAVAGALLTLSIQVTWALVGAALLAREHRRRRGLATSPPRSPSISAVVPVLNEAAQLATTVGYLRAIPEVSEIVVIDGGSSDGTVGVARGLGCRVVESARGRGVQLAAGVAASTGDVLWLVHADTWVSPGAGAALVRCLRDPLVVGGGFWKRFRQPPWVMRGARFRCWLRLWWNGRVLGDQAFFVRREALVRAGGIPEQPLMEDIELCRRLRRVGRLALAGAAVTTSERRFTERGVWRTYWLMLRVQWAYRRGVSPEELARVYERR